MDPMNPRPGDTFLHHRWITGSPKAGTAQPELCTVTRVTRTTVWYSGHRISRADFPNIVKTGK